MVDEYTIKEVDSFTIDEEGVRELADLMYHQWYNPYPHVRFTERPGLVCIHLLQGQIAVIVDHCPTAVLVPITLFECTSQIEEITQPGLERIIDFKNNDEYLTKVAKEGAEAATASAEKTIREVREIIGFRD